MKSKTSKNTLNRYRHLYRVKNSRCNPPKIALVVHEGTPPLAKKAAKGGSQKNLDEIGPYRRLRPPRSKIMVCVLRRKSEI